MMTTTKTTMTPDDSDEHPQRDDDHHDDDVNTDAPHPMRSGADDAQQEMVPVRTFTTFPFASLLAVILFASAAWVVSRMVGQHLGAAPQQSPGAADLAQTPIAAATVGSLSPQWTLKDPAGYEHSLSDYRGQLVVMDFWATWCGPCKAGMPAIQALHEKYGARGVSVIGINFQDDGDAAGYMKNKHYTYQLLLHGEQLGRAYGILAIPSIFVVDETGKIVYHALGSSPAKEQALDDLIAQHLKDQGR